MSEFFHGGVPGLQPGDWILPPDLTGATGTLSDYAAELDAPHGTRRDVVYVTTRAGIARFFAALYPDGAVYRVTPDGPLTPDLDAPATAFTTPRARIIAVERARVVFAHRTLESWIALLHRETASAARAVAA